MKFSLFDETRIGMRALNQDRLGHCDSGEALLLVLADGLGGHRHGELAAQLAVDTLRVAFRADARPRLANPGLFLSRAIGQAHARILEHAARERLTGTPRTTIVACVVQEGFAHWSHVGDSRLYLVRDRRLLARTRDHSLVQRLVDEGRLREEAASAHPDRNKLLQCLGSELPPRPGATASARLARNDVVLLCSDGLWGPVDERRLLHACGSPDLPRALRTLMTLAEARAGSRCDNVSVLAARWEEDEVPAAVVPRTFPLDEPPTDVQDFTASDAAISLMSDAEIDRAIEEIRAALKKGRGRQ